MTTPTANGEDALCCPYSAVLHLPQFFMPKTQLEQSKVHSHSPLLSGLPTLPSLHYRIFISIFPFPWLPLLSLQSSPFFTGTTPLDWKHAFLCTKHQFIPLIYQIWFGSWRPILVQRQSVPELEFHAPPLKWWMIGFWRLRSRSWMVAEFSELVLYVVAPLQSVEFLWILLDQFLITFRYFAITYNCLDNEVQAIPQI